MTVLYGGPGPLSAANSQFWHQDVAGVEGEAEPYEHFGRALTAGYFNADGFADLAIGVPWQNVGGVRAAGVVHVLYGSQGGLSQNVVNDTLWHQGRAGIADEPDDVDEFGRALAAGSFDGDGADELVIGVPGETLRGSGYRHGAVHVLRGGPWGPTELGSAFLHQGRGKSGDAPESRDHFGLVVGGGVLP